MHSQPANRYFARAPMRVDCAGGGSDAPPFCSEYGGHVVNLGISHYAYARVVPCVASDEVVITSLDLGETASAPNAQALEIDGTLDLLKGVVRRLNPPFGLRLSTESDVPPGTGLGSSGAMTVACVAAIDAAVGTWRSRQETAALANDIERHDLGMAGGCQDSYGAACGGINFITVPPSGKVTCDPIALEPGIRFLLEQRLVLAYTGAVHLSSSIHEDIQADYARPDSTTREAMKSLAAIATRMRSALETGDLVGFAALMNENWVQHKRLHPSCEGPALKGFYEHIAPYVSGAKTCGAGGGGCAILFAKEDRRHQLKAACREFGAELMPFTIDGAGLQTWHRAGSPASQPSYSEGS